MTNREKNSKTIKHDKKNSNYLSNKVTKVNRGIKEKKLKYINNQIIVILIIAQS